MSYTEEELSLLSDEERDAMADGQDEAVDVAEVAEVAESNDESAVAVQPEEEAVEREEAFMPQYKVTPVEGYQEKMGALASQKTDLRAKLNEGEISLDEYEAQKDSLIEQERTLHEQKLKADIAIERNEQVNKARWDWEQERFFDAKENALYSDKYLHAALNAAVIDLANDPAHADKKGGWFLQEADKLVRARFGKTEAAVPAKPESRKPDLTMVPKTLAHLPAADIPQTGDVGEFDHIDRLNGLELEKAVSRLSEAERERYRNVA